MDSDEIREIQHLVSQFPALFEAERRRRVETLGPDFNGETANLTGYFHTSEVGKPIPDTHGHYTGPKEEVSVVHKHKGGRRAHFHEEGDTNGNPSSQ